MGTITPRLLEDSETFKEAFRNPKFSGSATIDSYMDVVTPPDPTTIGGLRIRANANGDAVLQITNSAGTVELFRIGFRQGLMVTSALTTTNRALVDTKNDFLTASAGAFVAADAFWAGMRPFDLVEASTISIDLSKSVNFAVTLTDNRTLSFPLSLKVGQRGFIRVKQDSTGGRTLNFAAGYRYEDNVTAPTLNSAGGTVTILRYEVTATGEVTIYGGKGNTPVIVEATAQDYRNAVAGKLLAPDKVWAANAVVGISETDLTGGVDFRAFINATVTLTANRKLANPVPAGMKPGQAGCITFIQGGTGGYNLTFDTQWWSSGGVIPTLSPVVGSVNRLYYTITANGTVDFAVGVDMGRTYDPDVSAVFNAMTTKPNMARKSLINDLVLGLKDDGVWALLDNLWILAAHHSQASRINLVRPNQVLAIFGTPDFITDRGWRTTSGENAATVSRLISPDVFFGVNYKHNHVADFAYGIWQNTASTENSNGYLCGEAADTYYEYMSYNNTATTGRIAGNAASANGPATKGLKAVSHIRGETNMYLMLNNSPTAVAYGSGTANAPTAKWALLGAGAPGIMAGSNNRQAAAFTGAGLSVAQLTALYNRLNTYLTAVGAN